MDEEHWIFIDVDKKDGVSVVLMDANHCPGAVMFLFKGKMGTVLHTGDFRFHEKMLDNPWLCPPERRNASMRAVTVDVDFLHLDNTFANPNYDFPSKADAYKALVNIVKGHQTYQIFIFMYNLGKEEAFIGLANDFNTKVVVDSDRYRKVQLLNLSPEMFTTDPDIPNAMIHVKHIRELKNHE
jgi:DNA cross-link repair 1B protein